MPSSRARDAALFLAAGVLPLLLGAAGCDRQEEAPRCSAAVLITIDTLRADHLGCYGCERDTSPNLDRLAAAGVLFERCLTPLPRTTQSLASILTGVTPARHRVRSLHHVLGGEHVTLAERFHEAGFATAAFASLPYFPGPQGFDQGFGDGFELWLDAADRDVRADAVTAAALLWVEAQGDAPFFLWLHLRDPHRPYLPPAPFRARFDPEPYGPTRDSIVAAGARGKDAREQAARIQYGVEKLPPRVIERTIAFYDGEIAFTDQAIGAFLDGLRGLGRSDDALVLVTADHGESLGEHDYWFSHGDFLYDDCLRVPLIVRAPGLPARVVPEQVGVIDIAPSLIELFALAPGAEIEGASFAAALAGGAIRGRTLFAESDRPLPWEHNPRFGEVAPRDPADRLRGLCSSDRRKLILDPFPEDGPRLELYDLDQDPGETADLSRDPRHAADVARWSELLSRIAARDHGFGPDSIDPEMRKALEENGYLGGQ
ncbi:MAG: sulfatase [Planctomycetes bacterium]|nr:sulfatase [Planctomycetota bacterium]